MSYHSTLASSFPADCRIPHLENNLYIYGAGPLHKPSPIKYSSGRVQISKEEQVLHSRSSYREASPYSQSKSNKSTNPYTIPTNDSPSTGMLVQKTNELRDKRLEINERESRIFHTPENPSNSKYEKFEPNDSYSNIYSSAIPTRHNPGARPKENTRTMQEFQLFQDSPFLPEFQKNLLPNQLKDQEKSHRLQEHDRNQISRKEKQIEKEKQEFEHFLAIKKSEELQREREKEEYHQFLLKQEESAILEREKNQRKIQAEQEFQRKQAEELQRAQIERAEQLRQEEIRKFEYEKALHTRRQEELERAEQLRQEEIRKFEYEKALHARRQEELERAELEKAHRKRIEEEIQAENERVLILRNQEIQRAELEKERMRREHLEQVKRVKMEDRQKVQELEERLRMENFERQRLKDGLNQRQLALKEEIGRESRQFVKEKNFNQGNGDKNKICSPRNVKKDPSQPSSEGKTRILSSKSLNEKIRSLSARKNEPHYYQQTFSTKVKSMGNQSYKFTGAYRTGFK